MSRSKIITLIILSILIYGIMHIVIHSTTMPLIRYGLASLQVSLASLAIIGFALYALRSLSFLKILLAAVLVIFILPTYLKVAYQFAKAALQAKKGETMQPVTFEPEKSALEPMQPIERIQEIEEPPSELDFDIYEPEPKIDEPAEVLPPESDEMMEPTTGQELEIEEVGPVEQPILTQEIQTPQRPEPLEPSTTTPPEVTPQPFTPQPAVTPEEPILEQPIIRHPAQTTRPAVVEVADMQELETLMQEDSRPLVLKCSATWCPPCKIMKPIVEKVAQEMADSVQFAELDSDTFLDIYTLNVQQLPTVIYYKNGQEISRSIGARNEDEFRKEVVKLLA